MMTRRGWPVSIGQGALRVTFAYPSFGGSYKNSSPRLTIDGVDQPVRTWGSHIVPMPAGPHTVKVLVVAEDGDAFGLAEAAVGVELAGQTAVEYKAPRFHGSRGKLRIVRATST
jgi:hypothetical protein